MSFDRNRFDAIPTSPMIRNCLTNSSKLEGEIYFEGLTIVDENVEGELIMNSGLSLMKALVWVTYELMGQDVSTLVNRVDTLLTTS